MIDPIDRQAAIDALNGEITVTGETNAKAVMEYVNAVKGRLERIPPVQPKRGRWERKAGGVFLCSVCNNGYRNQPTLMGKPMFEYCPFCGADMRGEQDE